MDGVKTSLTTILRRERYLWEAIAEYKNSPTQENFKEVLLRGEKLLLYIVLKMSFKLPFYKVPLEDLYQDAVVVLGQTIRKEKLPKYNFLPFYLKSRIYRYCYRKYKNLAKEENLSALDLGCDVSEAYRLEKSDVYKEFESLLEVAKEKERKFIEEWLSLAGKRKPWVLYKRMNALLKRLRRRLLEDEELVKR